MVLQGDEAQVDAWFSLFGDSAYSWRKIGVQFPPNVPRANKSFWTQPMVVLGDVGHVESRFSQFGDSVGVGSR
jgi:hypothetical protein